MLYFRKFIKSIFMQEHIWIKLEDKSMPFIWEKPKKNIITLIIDIQDSVNTKLTCFLPIPAAKDTNCTIKMYITLLCTSLPGGQL